MGGSSLLRRGVSVSLAERFRLGTGGRRDARGARPSCMADVGGLLLRDSGSRSVGQRDERDSKKKKITLYLLARHIFHAFAGAEGSSERRKKVTPYIYC